MGNIKFTSLIKYCYACLYPSTWHTSFPTCKGVSQSPINILSSSRLTSQLGDFTLSRYLLPVIGKLKNDGFYLSFEFDSIFQPAIIPSFSPTITGGSLGTDIYEFFELHWHWGSLSSQGSEHTLDGRKYPAELHVSLFNKKYDGVTTALGNSDGLASLAFLFEVSSTDNPNLEDFMNQVATLSSLSTVPSTPTVPLSRSLNMTGRSIVSPSGVSNPGRILLGSLIPIESLSGNYYHYSGSLTAPPCDENVHWIVFETPFTISENQLNILRSLTNGGVTLSDNFRPTQPISTRTIYYKGSPTVIEAAVEIVTNAAVTATITTAIVVIINTLNLYGFSFGSGFITFGNSIAGSSFVPGFSGIGIPDICLPSDCRVIVNGRPKCCRRVVRRRRLVCPNTC